MIPLKFVHKVRINNILALVQIRAWRRPGDKPLSEPMMVSLLTHICVTQPQWAIMDMVMIRPGAGLLFIRGQTVTRNKGCIFIFWTLEKMLIEIQVKIPWFLFKKYISQISSETCGSFCASLDVFRSSVMAKLINPLRATFFRRNITTYLHFTSSLYNEWTFEIPHRVRLESAYCTQSIAWVLLTLFSLILVSQGARASATTILTMLNQNNSVPSLKRLIKLHKTSQTCTRHLTPPPPPIIIKYQEPERHRGYAASARSVLILFRPAVWHVYWWAVAENI